MPVLTITAPVLGTNCYLLTAEDGSECVVVDPGIGADDVIRAALRDHDLTPVAALVTHGHIDHTYSLAALGDVPAYIHEADAYRLSDPFGTLGPDLAAMLEASQKEYGGWTEPMEIRHIGRSAEPLELAGLSIEPLHAPGHTEGSTLFHVPAENMLLTGDVLFAGTIGRTDLPGGDNALMQQTLGQLAKPPADGGLPDDLIVAPGHGERSTLGAERATNPYLTNTTARSAHR